MMVDAARLKDEARPIKACQFGRLCLAVKLYCDAKEQPCKATVAGIVRYGHLYIEPDFTWVDARPHFVSIRSTLVSR